MTKKDMLDKIKEFGFKVYAEWNIRLGRNTFWVTQEVAARLVDRVVRPAMWVGPRQYNDYRKDLSDYVSYLLDNCSEDLKTIRGWNTWDGVTRDTKETVWAIQAELEIKRQQLTDAKRNLSEMKDRLESEIRRLKSFVEHMLPDHDLANKVRAEMAAQRGGVIED